MSTSTAYENKLYSNHVFNSDSSEDLSHLYSEDYDMTGGASDDIIDDEDGPTGGFPPIFLINPKKEAEMEKLKNRQLTANKTTVSIKDILKSKK